MARYETPRPGEPDDWRRDEEADDWRRDGEADDPAPRPSAGTLYGRRVRRLPADPLLLAASAVGATGLLLGALFAAAGALSGRADDGPPGAGGRPGSAGAGHPMTTPGGSAAGSNPPESTSTPSPTPTTALGPTAPRLLRSAVSALCLDIVPTGNPEGGDVHQVRCGAATSQHWLPAPVSGEIVTLVNAASAKCLDVDGESRADGAVVQQWSCTGRVSQRWRRVPTRIGTVLLVNVHSGRCVDLRNGNPAPGARMRQFNCRGTPNQQWIEQPPG